jgi:hypothetical protein
MRGSDELTTPSKPTTPRVQMPRKLKCRIRLGRRDRRIDMPSPGMLNVTRLVNLTHMVCVIGGPPNLPPNELSDSSGPLFSIYSKIVEEDDNKRAERHQKDAEGIVLFVSPHSCYTFLCTETKPIIDRFILRRSRCSDYSVDPRPQARPPG